MRSSRHFSGRPRPHRCKSNDLRDATTDNPAPDVFSVAGCVTISRKFTGRSQQLGNLRVTRQTAGEVLITGTVLQAGYNHGEFGFGGICVQSLAARLGNTKFAISKNNSKNGWRSFSHASRRDARDQNKQPLDRDSNVRMGFHVA